jgi:hypothetical protein
LQEKDKKIIKELLEIAVKVAHKLDAEVSEESLSEPQKNALHALRTHKSDTQELSETAVELLKIMVFNKVFNRNRFCVFHALTLKSIRWWQDSPVAKRLRKLSRDGDANV